MNQDISVAVTHPTIKSQTISERLYYMDNTRAVAMMLGIFLHGALTYASPSQHVWMLGDRQGSVILDASVWFIHLFRMGLFFLISGYFAKMLIEKRGAIGLLKNRLVRIVLPFVVFWPLLLVAYVAVIVFGLSYIQELPTVLAIIQATPADAPPPPPTTMHLWFLYYLAMFSLLSAGLSRFHWRFLTHSIDGLYTRPWLITLIPALLIPAMLAAGAPVAAPESFVPAWWAFVLHGLFYLAGWHLRGRERVLETLTRYAWLFLGISLVLFVPYYLWLPMTDLVAGKPIVTWKYVVDCSLAAFLSVYLTIAFLGLGKQFLSFQNSLLRYVSDASYWIYLIHLPTIMFLQILMVDWHASVWLKLFLSIMGTLAIGLVSYAVLVRPTPVGWMLNGRKRSPEKQAMSEPARPILDEPEAATS